MKHKSKMKVVDIGHTTNNLFRAMTTLETAVSEASFSGTIRAIKIITGHGSGQLRDAVREWCNEQEGRFKAVIPGEDYDMFHSDAVDMREECNQPYDVDYGRKNRAIIYIWLW